MPLGPSSTLGATIIFSGMLAYKLETNTLLLGTAAQQQQNNVRIGDENALSATTPKIQNTTQLTTSFLQNSWGLH